MDPTQLIGNAPATTDPLAWIAVLVVAALVCVLIWQLRASSVERRTVAADMATERRDAAADRAAALAAFRSELAAQRDHDSEQVHETHERITGLSTDARRLAERQ